jgi:hypothetical protein
VEHTIYLYFSRADLQKLALLPQSSILNLKSNGKIVVASAMKDNDTVELEYTTEVDVSDCECEREPHYNEGYD